jgi:hypothetical protein
MKPHEKMCMKFRCIVKQQIDLSGRILLIDLQIIATDEKATTK